MIRSVVAFAAATSTPLTALYFPLAVANALRRRTRSALIVSGAFATGLALQAVVVLHTGPGSAPVRRSFARLAELVGVRVFAEYLIGDKAISALWTVAPRWVGVLAPLIFALAFAALVSRADRRHAILAAVFAVYAVLLFVVPVWGRGTNAVLLSSHEPRMAFVGQTLGAASSHPGDEYIFSALRYSVVPVFLLASALAILVGVSASSRMDAVIRVGHALFVAQAVVLLVVGFSVRGPRSERLDWSASRRSTYRAQCIGRSPDKRVEVRTEPGLFIEYPVVLRCGDLRH